MPGRRKAIFVHGCFWHGHDCSKGRLPKSRKDYWRPKIRRNRERDSAATLALADLGWAAMTVWQCEIKEIGKLLRRLKRFVMK
jgi:DNA mismatch endonuclease (patch repair protein)